MSTVEGSAGTIVIADDERVHLRLLERWLVQRGYQVLLAEDGRQCLDLIHRVVPDVICLDIKMPRMDGLEALRRLKNLVPHVPVIMLSADDTVESVVHAMQLGAYDYLQKPCELQKLLAVIAHAVDKHRMAQRIVELERVSGQRSYEGILSQADSMTPLFKQLDRLVHSDISVLIHGESGTGKELVARAIHQYGGRANKPFVAVNCGAIAESLQESEFFGHEKGAFTGAHARAIGKIEQANGGTLFLDEIGEMPLNLQAALLRVLQEMRFTRVGGQAEVQVDFRLVAASHKRLIEQVEQGAFREDLYYRIAVFELELPALRQRPEDVVMLAEHFLAEFAAQDGVIKPELSPSAIERLEAYDWPGNIRELRNAMRRAIVVAEGGQVRAEDLPRALMRSLNPTPAMPGPAPIASSQPPIKAPPEQSVALPSSPRPQATHQTSQPTSSEAELSSSPYHVPLLPLSELERLAILRTMAHTGDNATESAKLLGISRATLYRKFKLYGIGAGAD